MNLEDELQRIGDAGVRDTVIAGVASAIGPVVGRSEVFTTVACHYVDAADADVITVYAVSHGRMLRFQCSIDGHTLSTCLPLDRVARISEESTAAKLSVVVEQDADRRTISGMIQPRSGDGGSGGGDLSLLSGNVFPAGWVIEATDAKSRGRLGAFARQLRAAVAIL